jgi:hypothetical protein
MRNRLRAGALVILALAVATTSAGCFASHAGSASNIGVRYTGSIFSGGKFHGCINAGDRITTSDHVYYLPGPGNQRQDQWQSGNTAADHQDLPVTSKDGVAMTMQVNVNFSMNPDCKVLDQFMRTIGLTRKAYFNADASYLPGWITAMNYYISPVAVKRIQTEVSKYDASELWPSTKLYNVVAAAVDGPKSGDSNGLQDAIAQATNGNHFYVGLSTDIYKITPDPAYASSIQARQQAKTDAATAQLNAKTQVAQAEAQAKVAKAQAQVTKAAISAYPTVNAYLRSLVIEKGGNPFQPQYVVGGTGPSTGGQ